MKLRKIDRRGLWYL